MLVGQKETSVTGTEEARGDVARSAIRSGGALLAWGGFGVLCDPEREATRRYFM